MGSGLGFRKTQQVPGWVLPRGPTVQVTLVGCGTSFLPPLRPLGLLSIRREDTFVCSDANTLWGLLGLFCRWLAGARPPALLGTGYARGAGRGRSGGEGDRGLKAPSPPPELQPWFRLSWRFRGPHLRGQGLGCTCDIFSWGSELSSREKGLIGQDGSPSPRPPPTPNLSQNKK